MEQKSCKFDLKEVDEAKGEFTGWASIYNNVDLGGDVVKPGAFTRTIKGTDGEVPLLWSHDPRSPLGAAKLEDKDKGLFVHGKINLEIPQGGWVFKLMRPMDGFKRAAIRGLSFGYDVVKHGYEGQTRLLQEVKLFEVSPVVFPMNPRANIATVKSAEQPTVKLLSFAKSDFPTDDLAVAWARAHEYKVEGLEDDGEAWRIVQNDAEFDDETLRPVEIDIGITAYMGQAKEKAPDINSAVTLFAKSITEIREEFIQFKATLIDQGFLDDPDLFHSLKVLQDTRLGNLLSDSLAGDGNDPDPDTRHSLEDLLREMQTFASETNS